MTTKVMDCDLVVLGAGGSGLVAAVKAFDQTGKKVIVIEKTRKPGGATYFAGGFGGIKDSKWQKDAGYKVNDPPDITGQIFDWLVSKGGMESFYKIAKPEEKKGDGIYTPDRTEKYKDLPDPSIGPGRGGSFIVDKLVESCQKQGIQILTETLPKKFVVDESGMVKGVLAEAKDGQILVNFKACVIAAGGWGANMEKLKKYYPKEFNNTKIHSLCPPACIGECIDMAEEIGAYIDPTVRSLEFSAGFYVSEPAHHPYCYAVYAILVDSKMVSINLDGKRWKNEDRTTGDTLGLGSQPGGVAYAVADDDTVEMIGSKLAEGIENSPEGQCFKRYRDEIAYEVAIDEEGASGNHTKKADTLVELALKMKIDPQAFLKTIERYNKFCETGKDMDFGKPVGMLKPVRKPPFYAFFGHRWSQCSKGRNGIAVNPKFEALNARGEVMPGLYAVGDGCTIFGGLVLNAHPGGAGVFGTPKGAAAAAHNSSSANPSGGKAQESFNMGGISMGGTTMRRMGFGAVHQTDNILSGEGSPCEGSSAALISGYYAGMSVADYLKSL
jgi:fumarate reductase flavoprotein subunit